MPYYIFNRLSVRHTHLCKAYRHQQLSLIQFVAFAFLCWVHKHLFSSWGNWRTAWENWTRVWHKNEARSESRTRMCFDVHILFKCLYCIHKAYTWNLIPNQSPKTYLHIILILDLRRVVWYKFNHVGKNCRCVET